MTQEAQQLLDSRFENLRQSLNDEQWKNADFLLTKVEVLREDDLALAFRVMQRVKVLSPSEKNKELLHELQIATLERFPELATTSSRDTKRKLLSKGNSALKSSWQFFYNFISVNVLRSSFGIIVILPVLCFCIYQLILASPRFESRAQIIIKEPDGMSTLDPTLAFMSGFGGPQLNTDIELLKIYVHSNDMLVYLEDKLGYSDHVSDESIDYFSRLGSDVSSEKTLRYFQKHITVDIEEKSQVLSVHAQGFTRDFAKKLAASIVERLEWYINEIGHELARAQLRFVESEHEGVQTKLKQAKSQLLEFQRLYDLLDPEAEGMARQQITYSIEAEIATKRAQIRMLQHSMSENAPAVVQAKSELDSMLNQLRDERLRLTSPIVLSQGTDGSLGVNEILSNYSDYKINLELALQAYTASQISLEKSRIEAYRQLKYLVTVESAMRPDSAKYPEAFYNISLLLVVLLMIFGIGKIVVATVDELRQ